MIFYVLTPFKIEAYEHSLSDFLPDDLMFAIQSDNVKIATDEKYLKLLQRAYPKHFTYEVRVGRKTRE